MERDNKYYKEEDIERILSPKCDFRVSSDFKDKVMQRVQAKPKHPYHRFMPWLAAAIASAAVVTLVFTMTSYHQDQLSKPIDKMKVAANYYGTDLHKGTKQQIEKEYDKKPIIVVSEQHANAMLSSEAKTTITPQSQSNDENEKLIPILEEKENIDQIKEESALKDGQDVLLIEDAPYVVFAQITEENHNEPTGTMPLFAANILGPMPIAPQSRYGINSVSLDREDPMEYVERLRQNIEEVENIIQNFYSKDNDIQQPLFDK